MRRWNLHVWLATSTGPDAPATDVAHALGAYLLRDDVALTGTFFAAGSTLFAYLLVLPRTLATDRPVPPPRAYRASPPVPMAPADCDSARARAKRSARLVRPFDQLGAQAQRYRLWALAHPSCVVPQDDYFAEEMAAFYNHWTADPHPLDTRPLMVILGTRGRSPPPGLSEAEWRSDSLRIDLSKLSERGTLLADSTSGHQVQLDNPRLVVESIRDVLARVAR